MWYVEHQSFLLDMRILWRTVFVWLRGEGVYAAREKFMVGKDDANHLGGGGDA